MMYNKDVQEETLRFLLKGRFTQQSSPTSPPEK